MRGVRRVAFLAAWAVVSSASAQEAPIQEGPIAEQIEAARKRLRVPGCSVAVVADGRIAWARGFGVQRYGADEPVTADTLFQAASISKPVAATAALRLVEQGLLALDQPVNELLTSWQVPDSPIAPAEQVTLRGLLCHGAGLSVHGFRGYLTGEEVPLLQDVLDGAKPANSGAVVIALPPGKQMQYSGGGYCVLQQLLLDTADESFPDLMRRLVLEPGGMKASTYEQPLPEARRARSATGHRALPVSPLPGTGFSTYPEMAAAGLWTTPTDLCRFALALQETLAGKRTDFLKQATVRDMVTPQVADNIGLGLFLEGKVEGVAGPVKFGHGGANEGFRCQLSAGRDQGVAAAVMTNSDGGGALCEEVMKIISREYQWPGEPAKQ